MFVYSCDVSLHQVPTLMMRRCNEYLRYKHWCIISS